MRSLSLSPLPAPAVLIHINPTRSTERTGDTRSGARAPVRGKAVLITPAGSGTGRAGAAAIASGSAPLRPLIAEAARRRLRLAFTIRMPKSGYLHTSGSRADSPGVRRDVIQRADHSEERSYGSAATGGFDATDIARRVDAAGGDVTAAVHQWLVETGRIHPSARITHLEIRTWRPRPSHGKCAQRRLRRAWDRDPLWVRVARAARIQGASDVPHGEEISAYIPV